MAAPNENLTQNTADPPHAYFNSHILFIVFVTEKNHLNRKCSGTLRRRKTPKQRHPGVLQQQSLQNQHFKKGSPGSGEWDGGIGNSPVPRWDYKLATVTLENSLDVHLRKEKWSYQRSCISSWKDTQRKASLQKSQAL